MTLILVDLLLVRAYDLISKQFIPTGDREILFGLISIGILATEYILLEFIKPLRTAAAAKKTIDLTRIYKVTKAVQYTLGAIVIFIILQIIVQSYYSTVALLAVIVCSYALSIGILGVFIKRILTWLSFGKNVIIFTAFLIASGSITINALITAIDVYLRLENRPAEIRLLLAGSIDVGKGRYNTIDDLYFLSYLISYISAWVATVVLLSYYSSRIGKVKYWIVTASPLVFFLVQFPLIFTKVLLPEVSINQFVIVSWITLIASLSKPIGGLMLAIGFWAVGRVGEKSNPVRHYMMVSGFGFLLLFTSNQAFLLSIVPYPPFGLSTITVMGLSAYLLIVGVFASSISASLDSELRKSIKQLAGSKLKLMDSIVTAEMAKEIEDKVREVFKLESVRMENETGIRTSLEEEDIQKYMREVLKEVKK
jgi:hypothetical protein